jgi:hypothetical protein
VLYNIIIMFGIKLKLVRFIKIYVNEIYTGIWTGKQLYNTAIILITGLLVLDWTSLPHSDR